MAGRKSFYIQCNKCKKRVQLNNASTQQTPTHTRQDVNFLSYVCKNAQFVANSQSLEILERVCLITSLLPCLTNS
jgi:hypothetical protein